MDHRRNTQMMQIPTHHQYVSNGVPFQSLSPSFVTNGAFLSASEREEMGFSNLSPPIDVDRSLSNVFSLLNLSPVSYADPSQFMPKTHAGLIGTSVGVDEGFVRAFDSPRASHSDFGVYGVSNHPLWCDTVDARRRHYSSGFDYGFDFDQKSHLGSKEFLYSTQLPDSIPIPISRCSSNLASAIADNKLKFQRSDDCYQINPCCSSNHHCGLALSKFHNQNQTHQLMNPLSLKDLRGRIYTMAKDQNGCRIIQAMFDRPTMEEIEIVLSEVVDFVSDLMKDQFGNYLVQKLVPLCNDDQKTQLLLSLTKVPTNIILVCMNPHGTRAVQKLLENLKDPNQVKLVMKALHRGAATLANDPNGHHVIQYCLVNFNSDINKPILNEIANECYKIATDRSGCCVLQACVEHSRGEVRTRIVSEIMANSVHLAEDPFGNYVLQHMVGLNIPEFTMLLVRQLQGSFAYLSCNKYASNVVEKCLNESGEEISTRIILELVRSPNSSSLLVDPYANFVIQSALKVSKGFAHECLRGLISKNMSSMRTNLYGKKILERFEKKRVNFA